jgi:hypothetical protein
MLPCRRHRARWLAIAPRSGLRSLAIAPRSGLRSLAIAPRRPGPLAIAPAR